MQTFPHLNNATINRVDEIDLAAHDWYRFVLSFPPHLVREYLGRFGLTPDDLVLDPFCGTGTTLVECKKMGIPSVGVEAHPMCHFASSVKTRWDVDPGGLLDHARSIAEETNRRISEQGLGEERELFKELALHEVLPQTLRTLPEGSSEILLQNSISPIPLHKVLTLLDVLEERADARFHDHELLALAKALVVSIGNLHFGPEVGIGTIKKDTRVVAAWMSCLRRISSDLEALQQFSSTSVNVHKADSRTLGRVLEPSSVSAVITSPPYPNEKDYTRTTRLESVLLGFIKNKHELKELKQHLLRSNTRNVYKHDDDDQWVSSHSDIDRIAASIEKRRIQLGRTSGFERLYHKVTRLYFGGMARHFAELRGVLRPGSLLAYVVGDQASYLRVMIRTGQLLSDVASSLGYEVVGIDLFRTRLATATRQQLREEILLLRWPGSTYKTSEPRIPYKHKEHEMASKSQDTIYSRIIEQIFLAHFKKGATEVTFDRAEITRVAKTLRVRLPKNLGDVIYSFRYRASLPEKVKEKAPLGMQWIIRPAGRSKYRFALVPEGEIMRGKVPFSCMPSYRRTVHHEREYCNV